MIGVPDAERRLIPDVEPAMPPPFVRLPGLRSIVQRGDYWCWAACVESEAYRHGQTRFHQVVARDFLECDPGCSPHHNVPEHCDKPVEVGDLPEVWETNGFLSEPVARAASLAEIRTHVQVWQRPIQVFRSRIHVELVVGFRERNNRVELLRMDPIQGYLVRAYYDDLTAKNELQWRHSLLNIRPKSGVFT